VARAETYLHAKFHLDPSNHLTTVHECRRQDRTDRQWTDSIGRTVLQTVAQKLHTTIFFRASGSVTGTWCVTNWIIISNYIAPMGVKYGMEEPPCQISPPSVQHVAPAG